MRVFARRERPHPGAQLTLFEAEDGWRYSLWVTNRPADTRGWLGQCAYIDAAHRVHARVEDVIRTGKDTGLGHFPSHDYGLNKSWLDASMTACILLSWLKLLALDGDLARAEPKTLRPAHCRPPCARRAPQNPENRRRLALGRGGHHRMAPHPGHPAPHLTSQNPSRRAGKDTPGTVEPPASRATVIPWP